MIVRKSTRLEVRLDPERRAALDEIVARQGLTVAEWLRQAIDRERRPSVPEVSEDEFEDVLGLELDLPSDPAEMKRLVVGAHCPGPEFCDCRPSS